MSKLDRRSQILRGFHYIKLGAGLLSTCRYPGRFRVSCRLGLMHMDRPTLRGPQERRRIFGFCGYPFFLSVRLFWQAGERTLAELFCFEFLFFHFWTAQLVRDVDTNLSQIG